MGTETLKRALLVAPILLMAGCSGMQVEGDVDFVDCEVEPVDQDWNPMIQPFYFPDRVDEFNEALLERSSDIRVVDAAGLWAEVFPGRDPDADVRANEFCQRELTKQLSVLGIHYLIVLDTIPKTTYKVTTFAIVYLGELENSINGAVLLDISCANCDRDLYVARAEGTAHGLFIPPIISQPRTHLHALRTLTDRLATDILERSPERPINVVILAARP